MKRQKIIIFSGGGTFGSVTPLLAVHTQLKRRHTGFRFLWVGTRGGNEEAFVKQYGLKYKSIYAGKLRRYFSLKNIFTFVNIFLGFLQSLWLLVFLRPALMISAGGYVSVPLHWAGWILRIKSVILQQDLEIGLANKLMAPFSTRIFVSLPEALNYFSKEHAVVVGNPVREDIQGCSKEEGIKKLGLDPSVPVVLVVGGGGGAAAINRLVEKSLGQLVQFCQVIHLTGEGKSGNSKELAKKYEHYHPYTFVRGAMMYALNAADVVVSRGGFGSLSELSALGKPAIIIPIPDSHQEKNAEFFLARKAIEVMDERTISSDLFAQAVRDLVHDEVRRGQLAKQINAVFIDTRGEKFVEELEKILES